MTKPAAVSESRLEHGIGTLLLADAFAVLVGTAGAFVFRAAVRSYDSLAPSHLASLILPALPLALVTCLLALWWAGRYGSRRDDLGPLDVAAPLAWAASLLTFIAFYWEKGPETPFFVMAVGYALTLASMVGVRAFVRSRELAHSS